MNLYAESSAVASWLFGESRGAEIGRILGSANTIATSDLTLIECFRAIHRAMAQGAISATDAQRLVRDLVERSSHWMVSRINPEVVAAASRRYPVEPVRTLDAIHLATAVRTRLAIPELAVLTLDKRIATNARELGIRVLPVP